MNHFLPILAGTWFIISTNFPMWLKGDKTHPTFNYTLIEKNGKQQLLDEVKYIKNGKSKTITGYDTPVEENEKAFTWRGKGLLFFVKSHWEVKLLDSNEKWAVIWFSKTLFTPEGVDIICRDQKPGDEVLENIRTRMQSDSLLKKHVASIRKL